MTTSMDSSRSASVTNFRPSRDGAQRRFVDDVGKLRAGRAGGHPRDLLEVHVVGDFDLFRVYLQDGFTALQVGQLHRHPAVKPAGTGQGGVKGFGAVGGREDDDAGVAFKAVHFGEQLVQRLLPLVIAAHGAGRPASGRWRQSRR